MGWEQECKFVWMVQALAYAEVGFVAWLGQKLLRCVEGSASFHPHLSLLLPRGEFGGWGVGKRRVGVVFALGWGRGGEWEKVEHFGGGVARRFPRVRRKFPCGVHCLLFPTLLDL